MPQELALYPGLVVTIRASILATADTAGAWGVGVWDTAKWGGVPIASDNPGTGNWADISTYTKSFKTGLGRNRETDQYTAGTGMFTLDNVDGRFSKANTASPYVVGGLMGARPWQAIQVLLTVGGITFVIWTGMITSFRDGFDPQTLRPISYVNAIDLLGQVGSVNLYPLASPSPAELSGARVQRILTAAGVQWLTTIAAGTQTMQPTLLGQNALTEIQNVARSENGAFFHDPLFGLVFEDANALVTNTRSTTVQATIGDGAGELPYESVELADDGTLLYNFANAQRIGGVLQQAIDQSSIALYGTHAPSPLTGLLNVDDYMPAQIAAWFVKRYGNPEQRVVASTFHPSANPILTNLATLRIRDRVLVKHRPRSSTAYTITREAFVDGIDHTYDAASGEWWTTMRYADATAYDGVGAWDSGLWDTALWFT